MATELAYGLREHEPVIDWLSDYEPTLADNCRDCFETFVREFWDEVPGTEPLQWNWHMRVICQELQIVAEDVINNRPRQHHLIINVPPGTSKSTLVSILFPAWVWTRMARCRIVTASHTDDLVLDLSSKSRDVIKSDRYKRLFPWVQIRPDRDATGRFATTEGGDRFSCTVAGKSPTGRHGHIILCLPWESRIITDRGVLPIGRVVDERLPVRVLGYDHNAGKPRWQKIDCYEKSPGKPVCRVVFTDGTYLESTEEHPVFVQGRGYVPAIEVHPGDEVLCVKELPSVRKGDRSNRRDLVAEEQRVLRFGVCGECPPTSKEALPGLREETAGHCRQVHNDLQQRMPDDDFEWREAPPIQQASAELCGLRRVHESSERTPSDAAVLQQSVQGKVIAGHEQSGVQAPDRDELWILRDFDLQTSLHGRNGTVLHAGMCQQSTCDQGRGKEQSELHSRTRAETVPQGIQRDQATDSEERELLLLDLRQESEGQQEGPRCPPHRLGQGEQQQGELGCLVSCLPQEPSREPEQAIATNAKVVSHVVRGVRLPDAVYNVRCVEDHNYFAEGVLVHNCDDPIDPKKANSELELKNAKDFFDSVIMSRTVNKEVAVLILIMQRLHEEDPTGHLLRKSRRDGADAIRHIRLPAELPKGDDGNWDTSVVTPQELAKRYIDYNQDAKMEPDGLLDPVRLTRRTLNARRTDGAYVFSGQYMQWPVPLGGGMFKETYFAQRVKAAPFDCQRVLYCDRASTEGGGCFTAMVCLAKSKDGRFFIEWAKRGQWEPYERNQQILAAAIKLRNRFGPRYEPVIQIEREGGASGKGDFQQIARLLAGFKIKEHNISGMGKKEHRAEPWSSQLAAGNVWVVDNGEKEGTGSPDWDIEGYVHEHVLFPKGTYKDQVDASSGAFLCLTGKAESKGLQILSTKVGKAKELRIVCGDYTTLEQTVFEDNCLLVLLHDVPPSGEEQELVMPKHGMQSLLDTLHLQFADVQPIEHQEDWDQPLPGYGRTTEEVMMTRDHAKKLWSFLTKQRPAYAINWVFIDNGDRRAKSIAQAVCAILGKKPESSLLSLLSPHIRVAADDVPNKHVFDMSKLGRSLVI